MNSKKILSLSFILLTWCISLSAVQTLNWSGGGTFLLHIQAPGTPGTAGAVNDSKLFTFDNDGNPSGSITIEMDENLTGITLNYTVNSISGPGTPTQGGRDLTTVAGNVVTAISGAGPQSATTASFTATMDAASADAGEYYRVVTLTILP